MKISQPLIGKLDKLSETEKQHYLKDVEKIYRYLDESHIHPKIKKEDLQATKYSDKELLQIKRNLIYNKEKVQVNNKMKPILFLEEYHKENAKELGFYDCIKKHRDTSITSSKTIGMMIGRENFLNKVEELSEKNFYRMISLDTMQVSGNWIYKGQIGGFIDEETIKNSSNKLFFLSKDSVAVNSEIGKDTFIKNSRLINSKIYGSEIYNSRIVNSSVTKVPVNKNIHFSVANSNLNNSTFQGHFNIEKTKIDNSTFNGNFKIYDSSICNIGIKSMKSNWENIVNKTLQNSEFAIEKTIYSSLVEAEKSLLDDRSILEAEYIYNCCEHSNSAKNSDIKEIKQSNTTFYIAPVNFETQNLKIGGKNYKNHVLIGYETEDIFIKGHKESKIHLQNLSKIDKDKNIEI